MATIDWPSDDSFVPRAFSFGASTPKSAFGGFFSGQQQSISHLADRLRISLTLKPCRPEEAGRREAYFTELMNRGHWVRLHHLLRPLPLGTLRGSPTVAVSAAAGATSLQVSTTAGATLQGGDMLGAAGGQLLMAGFAGAVADGTGAMSLPLALPLRAPLASGAALTWLQPEASFQMQAGQVEFVYGRAGWQAPLELVLQEVY